MTSFSAVIPYVRDRFTWLGYFMLAYYAYMQATLGPLTPFLRAELSLSYFLTGLHLSAFAAGMIAAGLTGDRVAARFGRGRVFWGGGAGMALGGLLLIIGRDPVITIAASLMMGVAGSYTLVMVQSTLSDHQGNRRAIALTEANVCASIAATLAPALISLSEQAEIGWRIAPLAGLAFWLILMANYRREPMPVPHSDAHTDMNGVQRRARLPRTFWIFWAMIVLGVSVEWCMIFWGADFLEIRVGLPRVTAAGSMTFFFAATVIGRIAGSRLARLTRPINLLLVAVLLVIIGFPIFWLGQSPVVNIIGLIIVGFGVSNLFPMTISAVTMLVPQLSDLVSARAAFGAGTAILISPQILATAADDIGIFNAYGIAGLLCIAVLLLTVAAWRITRHRA